MTREPLTPFWLQWRLDRITELKNEGFGPALAASMAGFETRGRMAAARVIGRDAALDADVVTRFLPNGRFETVALVDPAAIPTSMRSNAEAWAARRATNAAH